MISISLKALDPIRFAFGKPGNGKVSVDGRKASIEAEKVSVDGENVSIETYLKKLDLTAPTYANVVKLYKALSDGEIFGRSRIMEITGLEISGAGKFLNAMLKLKLLESVVGHGKGKYRFKNYIQ